MASEGSPGSETGGSFRRTRSKQSVTDFDDARSERSGYAAGAGAGAGASSPKAPKTPKTPARMRRFTVAAAPELWTRAQAVEEETQTREVDKETRFHANNLRKQLAAMTKSVAAYNDSVRSPAGGAGGGAGGGESDEEGGGEGDGASYDEYGYGGGGGDDYGGYRGYAAHADPEIDPAKFLVEDGEGWLDMKDLQRGGLFQGKRWRQLFFRLQDTELSFYKGRDSDRPQGSIVIDEYTEVRKGNKEVKHRNPNIKYDFEVVKGQKVYQLNARTMTEANNWIDTIQYVIDQCEKAAEGGPVPDGEFMPRKRDPEEEAAARDAAVRHHAYGTGLFEGVRGEQSEFTIQAYDEYDNPKTYGGDEFKITIENEELHFDVRAIDNNDGTYSVAYTPTQTGEFLLSITIDNCDIYGSPYHPAVAAAPTSAMHCACTGAGLALAEAAPGYVNEFTIVARDQFDGDRGVGGDKFEVATSGPAEVVGIEDLGNGRYIVRYTVNVTPAQVARLGQPTVQFAVALNNDGFAYPRPVSGSPFSPRVNVPLETLQAAQIVRSDPQAMAAAISAAATPARGSSTATSAPSTMHTPAYLARAMAAPATGSPAYTTSPAQRPQARAAPAGYAPGGSALTDMHLQATMNVLRAAGAYNGGGGGAPAGAPPGGMASPAQGGYDPVEERRRQLAAEEARLNALRQSIEAEKAAVEANRARMEALSHEVRARTDQLSAQADAAIARSPANAARRSPANNGTPASQGYASPPPRATPTQGDASGAPGAFLQSPPAARGGAGGGAGSSAATPGGGLPATHGPSSGAPRELFDPQVIEMFDKYKRSLHALFTHYSGDAGGIRRGKFVQMLMDYDIVPTFLETKETKPIFAAVAAAEAPGVEVKSAVIGYGGFVELLGRVALYALDKPVYAKLYDSPKAKVSVLLEMWAIGDPRKLAEVQSR